MTSTTERRFFGHPVGLSTLFFTEMWERFSYYGMRALLILFLRAPASSGGLGLDVTVAGTMYGLYTSSAYLAALPGGWLADRFFGQQNAVLYGGILIAIGQFVLAVPEMWATVIGLAMVAAGTGLLKPNVSTIVGQLYDEKDRRRDAGFSIFYMGINIGAMISPIVCGWIGQTISYRYGFAAAGVGMILGLIQYQLGRKNLGTAGRDPAPRRAKTATGGGEWTGEEIRRLIALGVLVAASAIFWSLFEQAGSTLNLFAEDKTRNEAFGFAFPSSWFQSLNSIFLILLAPPLAWLWLKLGERDPSPVIKFSLALLLVGAGFLVVVPAARIAEGGAPVSPMWLTVLYLLHTIGELCLSPVGLSATTKLAPLRIAGFMMGVWFLSVSIGNFVGGQVSALYGSMALPDLFQTVGLVGVASGIVLALFTRPITRLMGGVK